MASVQVPDGQQHVFELDHYSWIKQWLWERGMHPHRIRLQQWLAWQPLQGWHQNV